jgi:hypothetical protein
MLKEQTVQGREGAGTIASGAREAVEADENFAGRNPAWERTAKENRKASLTRPGNNVRIRLGLIVKSEILVDWGN